MPDAALVELAGVVKDYRALRPLRIHRLAIREGERLAVGGFDLAGAELLVNLITGAALPDSGTITLFGRDSRAITDSADWLGVVDRFGIVSVRTVLLESLSVAQNLALPFSLDIEPLTADLRSRAMDAGREVGLPLPERADTPVSALSARDRFAVRLARALAFNPAVVVLEHPTAELAGEDAERVGRDTRRVLDERNAAGLALTSDERFSLGFAGELLRWNGATGRIESSRGWLGRFRTRP